VLLKKVREHGKKSKLQQKQRTAKHNNHKHTRWVNFTEREAYRLKFKRFQWAGHVHRLPLTGNPKTALKAEFPGN
jgi:hypothetical protein